MAVADRILVNVANRRRLGADLTRAVLSIDRTGSIESKPNVAILVDDPHDRLMESRILTRPVQRATGYAAGHALRPIDLELDGVWYRLWQARRTGDGVQLTFDHRAAVMMSEIDDPISASRGKVTRAQFIRRQVQEVNRRRGGGYNLSFWAPEVRRRMPVAAPDVDLSSRSEDDRDVAGTLELAKSGKGLTVKGVKADAEQRKNMAIFAEEAAATGAPPRAELAGNCAAIGESDYRDVPNSAGSPYGGVWQALKTRGMSTRDQARAFLLGGQGFQQGGAISLARKNPGMSPGEIATRVEASGKPGSFYDAHRREAEAIVAAMGGVTAPGGGEVGGSYIKPYRFKREEGEDAWESTGKLAEEVGRRRFITVPSRGRDLFVYAAETDLLRLPAQARLLFDAPYVVGRPEYDLDYGKTARSMRMEVLGDAFEQDFAWGIPVWVDDAGPASGKWLVTDVSETDGSEAVTIELRQPQAPKPEPASERVQRADPTDSEPDGQVRALARVELGSAWAGTSSIFSQFVSPFLRREFDFAEGSKKRSTQSTATGNMSDHFQGKTNAYAIDYPAGESAAIKAGRALAEAMGISGWQPNVYGSHTVRIGGKSFRVQILAGSGIDHGDHLHVGIAAS